ncbi:CBS domain-containing protein [Thiovibrio sp. JS02]
MKIKKLRVKDLMQAGVKTIARDATLKAAAKAMYEQKVSSLVVKPADDSDAFGIVTRKDVLEAMLMDSEGDFSYLVSDVMTKPAITVGPNLSIENCLLLMRVAGTRRLPVVEGEKLVGIISNTDVFDRLVSGK